MRIRVCVLVLILFFVPGVIKSEDVPAVKIAVLPLEVFNFEKEYDLGQEVSMKLLKQLSMNPYIYTCDLKHVKSILRQDEHGSIEEKRLKEIAKILGANFILSGSITKIMDEVSIDVKVFNSFSNEKYFKTFAGGVDIDALIEKISAQVEQDVLAKADLIPPSQRSELKSSIKSGRVMQGGTNSPDDYEDEIVQETGISDEKIIIAGKGEMNEEFESVRDQPANEPFVIYSDSRDKEPSFDGEVKETTIKKRKRKKNLDLASFKSDMPISINADSMEYDNRKNTALFKGNVVARQGSILMFADNMKVQYGAKGGLKRLFATGNVKIIQGERIATGKKIVFYNDQQKIVATGNPRVWQGDNVVQGKKITVFLKEDRTVVEGGPENRASATIYPDKKKAEKD